MKDVSFCNVKTKMMMRNSNAALSFKLKTTASSVGRGNQEAAAGGQSHSRGGRCGEFGGEENQAGQVGAGPSQESCASTFFTADISVFLYCLHAHSKKRSRV